jgi:hypothetical protein
MKKFLFVLLASLAVCMTANAQSMYVAAESTNGIVLVNLRTGDYQELDADIPVDIGIDDRGYTYVLGYDKKSETFKVWLNGQLQQQYFASDWGGDMFSSVAMKIVGNDVVIACVLLRKFNKNGYEARQMGFVNGNIKYRTDWERKSLKRDQFQGYYNISGSGRSIKVSLPEYNHNPYVLKDRDSRSLSQVMFIADVDYVNGDIYTTGWGEREFTETPVGYQKQYLVRRCPRVWKNGKLLVEQYQNRTGAAWSINVMRGGKNILTSGHQRGNVCAWDGNKDMISSGEGEIIKEAVIDCGNLDGAPVFMRAYILKESDGNHIYYNVTGKNGDLKPEIMQIKDDFQDIVAYQNKFYFLVSDILNGKRRLCLCSVSSPNWTSGNFEYNFRERITFVPVVKGKCILAVK